MLAVSPMLFALQETVMLPVPRRWSSPAEIMEPMFEMPVVWPICFSAYRYICILSRNSRDFRNGRNDARLVGEGKVEEREIWLELWDGRESTALRQQDMQYLTPPRTHAHAGCEIALEQPPLIY